MRRIRHINPNLHLLTLSIASEFDSDILLLSVTSDGIRHKILRIALSIRQQIFFSLFSQSDVSDVFLLVVMIKIIISIFAYGDIYISDVRVND